MKKLIAIAVVFALVAGVAFAEINVSGEVFGKITPLFGDSSEGNDGKVHATGEMRRIRLEASGQDDNGVFGGYIRIDHAPWWTGSWNGDLAVVGSETGILTGNVWWKPIEQFKLTLGGNGSDGFFGADGVTRWGFYQVAADGVGVAEENWVWSSSFFGGFDPLYSALLTVTPIEGLEINVGIPFWNGGAEAKDIYNFINAQVAYNISGIGKLALTYAGNTNEGLDDGSKMWAYFGLSAIENLGLDIGLGFQFPGSDSDADATNNPPIAIGLGASYGAGGFGIKARFQAVLGGSSKVGSTETKGDTDIAVDILPSYAISDNATVFLSVGMAINSPDSGDSTTSWHINPYVALKSNWWAPNFYAGLRISSDGAKGSSGDGDASRVDWSVPIGIAIHF